MKKMLKKIVKELEALIKEAKDECLELTEEECEREREIEAREFDMEIAAGGFHECMDLMGLSDEDKEKLAFWFNRYADDARELIKMERLH